VDSAAKGAAILENDPVVGRGRRALLAVTLVAVLSAAPAAAEAACGGVEKAHPKRKVAKVPPLAIGDSVMLFALPNLARKGFNVDARGCRQFEEGIHLLIRKRRQNRLPYLSVIALGADAGISGRQINRVKKIIGPKRKIGLVVPLETGGSESNDARVVRQAGRRDPEQVKVLDWPRYSRGHANWFQPDHLHLTFAGAAAYARLMGKLIPLADGCPKRDCHGKKKKKPKKPR
jgi:hypothetical protein